MSDSITLAQTEPVSAPLTHTAGAKLRAAREAQGLHIGALAVSLKVPVKKLEALEADRYDLLPGTVFVRALALSVCRHLRLEPESILAALPKSEPPVAMADLAGLNTSFKSAQPGGAYFSLRQLPSPAFFAAMALLVAIAVVYWWPSAGWSPMGAEKPADLTQAPQGAVEGAAAPAPVIASTAAASAPDNTALAPSPALASASSPLAGDAAARPSNPDMLTLQARGQSWVEVTDGTGKMLLRKLTSTGEVLQLSGALPMQVVVGRSDLVSAFVRGTPFDLANVSSNNVARFEVK